MSLIVSGGYGRCVPCEEKQYDINFWNEVKAGNPYAPSSIYITSAGHKGFGVFARNNIKQNEPIEYCHSLVLNERTSETTDAKIMQYAYTFVDEFFASMGKVNIIPFGFGEIYNSAESKEEANARFIVHLDHKLIVFRANKDIKKGSEILVWWGQAYYDKWIKNKSI